MRRPPSPRRPVSPRRALIGFAAVALVVGAAVSTITTVVAERIARHDVVTDAEDTARRVQQSVVASLATDRTPDLVTHFERTLRPQVQAGVLARVKVWQRVEGDRLRVVYSDHAELIGQEKDLLPGRAALIGTDAALVLPVPDDAAHRTEHDPGTERVEVFTAFAVGERQYLLESYLDTDTTARTARTRAHLVPVLVGGMGVFTLATLPLALGLARALTRAERERELLLERADRESERERLWLGQQLHDGVIQDLAGASMALTAMSQGTPDPERIESVAGLLRGNLHELRSMLEDLMPAAVSWAELGPAVTTLAQGLGLSGADVRVADAGADVDDATAALLHRITRELLVNVVRHADATAVRVALSSEAGSARLQVSDDGRGFATGDCPRAGHLGLRIVEHVVQGAGGTLAVRSAPGAGTTVTVTLPTAASGRV